jgi:plasmid stabilization system protein ParE
MQVRYTDEAIDDVQEILDYLSDRSPTTASRFEMELVALTAKLGKHPEIGYPVGSLGVRIYRKAEFRSLPWSVVYWTDAVQEKIWIVVVRHRSRHPSYGMKRGVPSDPLP